MYRRNYEITKPKYGELTAPENTVGYSRNNPQGKTSSKESWTSYLSHYHILFSF
jgi:hypothetical protein